MISTEKYLDRTFIKASKTTKIMKVDANTKHLPIASLVEGKTYQTHNRDIVLIKKIDNTKKIVTLRNISQYCNQFTEFKNLFIVKAF